MRGGVPAQQRLAGRGLEHQGQHVLLVLDVDLDLVLLLGVGDGEAGPHLDLGAIFGTGAYQGANDPRGLGVFTDVASDGMVEDGEDSLEAGRAIYQPLNMFFFYSSLFPLSISFSFAFLQTSLPWTLALSWQDHIYLGLDLDSKRGNVRLEPDVGVSQRASEVQKPFRCGSHTGRKEKRYVSTTQKDVEGLVFSF